MKKRGKKKSWKIVPWVAFSSAIIFLFLLTLLLGIYKFQWRNGFFTTATKIAPFPAFYVKGAGMIRISELRENMVAVKKFYESQEFEKIGMRVDFETDQGKKRLKIKEREIINKLIENLVIESLARERGILVSDQIVEEELSSNIENFGNRQNLMSELARLYGWSLEDFKEKVVKPELYAERLSETFLNEVDMSERENKINILYERVAKKKEDFEKVAREASEGESSAQGGDLGWSTKDQLVPEIAEQAFSLKTGEVSDILESPLGFHILRLEEKKSEGDQELVHLRQIFVKTKNFGDWLREKMGNFRVFAFLNDYQWNAKKRSIEFKDENLRQFEANLDNNSQGDPSVFP